MTENTPAITEEYTLKEFGWSKSRFETIQRMYFKGLSMDDIAVFGHVCKHVGLDPFLRQIYPVVRNVTQPDKTKKPVMSIQTGIDGYRAIAERTGKYSPGKEPLFKYDKDGRLFSATAYVMKMTNDGKWHEVAATAILSEYRPAFQNDFWSTKPHIMISKCAEALAIRKAFPAELSGVYTKEEMDQAGSQDIPKAEYEEIKHINQVDTKIDDFKCVSDLTQEPYLSAEELTVFLTNYANTTDDFKENFERYIAKEWQVKDFKYIKEKNYPLVMSWIAKNIEMQSMPQGK